MPHSILLVDDEKNILLTLSQALQLAGYHTELAGTGRLALEVALARPVDAVLLDVQLPDMDGIAVLEQLLQARPGLPVLMMSGHGTIETAVRATRLGARDFLEKPIGRERLLVALRNALEHQAAVEELETLRSESGRYEMVGQGPAMQRLYHLVQRAAPSEGRVLITGENGSGKELVARALHRNSRRASGPFVRVNCAAVPHELIESELFGHEKGAFTGALALRRGKFELASGGTLFLDEVGDMPPTMQAKLLRVLQEAEFERVGGTETLKVDVRLITATNKDLAAEVAAGRFREDLFYRLNVISVTLPPLRARKGDIPALVSHFMRRFTDVHGKKIQGLAPGTLQALLRHDWPGNVRELENSIERAVVLAQGPYLTTDDLPPTVLGARPSDRPMSSLIPGATWEEIEKEAILRTLEVVAGSTSRAAAMLGISTRTIQYRLKQYAQEREGSTGPQSAATSGSASES